MCPAGTQTHMSIKAFQLKSLSNKQGTLRAESAFGFWFIHDKTTAMADAAIVPRYSARASLNGFAVMVKEVR